MKHSNSSVSIDQVAQLAGQAGVCQHENMRDFDRATLQSAANDTPAEKGMSPAQQILHLLITLLRV